MIESDKMYLTSEVGGILRLSEQTIRAYCRDGVIKAKKIENDWRVRGGDLEEYIDQLPSNV